jgi:hypothetical protein
MDERNDGGMRRELGISRRELMRRGVVVGGTLAWAAPVVQTMGAKAFAQMGTSPGTCAACYCWNGDKQNPSVGSGGGIDECSDNGLFVHRMNRDTCENWCKHNAPFNAPQTGAPGGPYENSEYCSGTTSCECNTANDPGPNGVTCT